MIKTRKCFILSALLIICYTNLAAVEQQFDVTLANIESPIHKKRMRKPVNKEKKIKKARTYLEMTYEELVVAKDRQLAHNNVASAIKYLEQMMKLCNDITLLADHLLEIADLFFVDAQCNKASMLYTQYCALYPGSPKQEYALYRSIKSSFACILSVDRDQTRTEETLALAETFLQQDHFTLYRDEVVTIQTQCYQQLAASECNICSFYLTRGRLAAAEKRVKRIRMHWLPKLATIEPELIALETELAAQKEEAVLAHAQRTQLAQNKKTKHMAERF